MSLLCIYRSDIHVTNGNIHTKGAQTWMPQEENSVGTGKELCPQTNVV
jgi:hypothetical protein